MLIWDSDYSYYCGIFFVSICSMKYAINLSLVIPFEKDLSCAAQVLQTSKMFVCRGIGSQRSVKIKK